MVYTLPAANLLDASRGTLGGCDLNLTPSHLFSCQKEKVQSLHPHFFYWGGGVTALQNSYKPYQVQRST